MINEIVNALGKIPGLENKVFPLGFLADNVSGCCCVYNVVGPDPYRTLNGELHHWTATVMADLLCPDYYDCLLLYQQVQIELEDIADIDGVIGLAINCQEPDAYAADVERFRKRVAIKVDWRA